MSVSIRDKTTASQQLAVASDGSITASIKGNGTPPSRTMYYWTVNPTAFTATSEMAALTIHESASGAAESTFTSRVVTSGKTMRITSLIVTAENGGTTPVASRIYVHVRFNTAGAATNSSQIVAKIGCGLSQSSTQKTMNTTVAVWPDGMEFLGDGTKQICLSAICPDWVTTTQIPSVAISAVLYEY